MTIRQCRQLPASCRGDGMLLSKEPILSLLEEEPNFQIPETKCFGDHFPDQISFSTIYVRKDACANPLIYFRAIQQDLFFVSVLLFIP